MLPFHGQPQQEPEIRMCLHTETWMEAQHGLRKGDMVEATIVSAYPTGQVEVSICHQGGRIFSLAFDTQKQYDEYFQTADPHE